MNETGASDVSQGVVVVGTDGSKGSVHALRFAFEEALRRGVGAEVITAWTVTSPYTDDYSAPVLDEARTQRSRLARAVTGSVSAECLENSSVPVILVPAPGPGDPASLQHQAMVESPASGASDAG